MKKQVWKAVSLLLCVILCSAWIFPASADTVGGKVSEDVDNLTWSYNDETGELVISGEGAIPDYTRKYQRQFEEYLPEP